MTEDLKSISRTNNNISLSNCCRHRIKYPSLYLMRHDHITLVDRVAFKIRDDLSTMYRASKILDFLNVFKS